MPHAEKEIITEPVVNGEKAHSHFLDVSRPSKSFLKHCH